MLTLDRVLSTELRSTFLGAGRSLLAIAELMVIAFTSDADLFPSIDGAPGSPQCDDLRGVSLWCLGPGTLDPTVARFVAIAVLVTVAAGYRPRWTCMPHWYVTFSFSAVLVLPSGGEHVAKVAALLLIPILLGDNRRWHWTQPRTPLPPRWQGMAVAGHLAIRAHVASIYGQSLWSKLREPQWRDGSAMHYVVQDAHFGATAEFRAFFEAAEWVIPPMTWGTLAAEASLALSAFCRPRIRRWALCVGLVLHIGIIVVLGLFSFGLIMIGLLAISASSAAPHRADHDGKGGGWAALISSCRMRSRMRPRSLRSV